MLFRTRGVTFFVHYLRKMFCFQPYFLEAIWNLEAYRHTEIIVYELSTRHLAFKGPVKRSVSCNDKAVSSIIACSNE